jgi:hypothetical protein
MSRRILLILCTAVFFCYYVCGADVGVSNRRSQQNGVLLNDCLVSHWSEATVWTVAFDELRDLAFVGSCGCIFVLDVSDPANPVQLSQFRHSPCNTCGFYYSQDQRVLYVCSGVSGFTIWDLKDPAEPVKIGFLETPGYASSVDVIGQYAFVVCADAGLHVIDVSCPSEPKEIGHFDMTSATCIQVMDNYAYVADLGLRILDISVPSNPMEISYHETPGVAFGLYVSGDRAYVADDCCGLRVIDVSNPKQPHELGHFLTPGYAWDVYVADSHAYVSACEEGLHVIDVTYADNPREIAYYETSDAIVNAHVLDSHIYMADAANGLQIISLTAAANVPGR